MVALYVVHCSQMWHCCYLEGSLWSQPHCTTEFLHMANNGSAIKANPGALSLLWFQTRMPECSSTPLLPSEPPEHSKWQESSSPKQCIFHAGNRPWLDDSSRQGRTSFHHLLQRQLETRAETAILRQPCLTVLVTLMDKTRAGMGRGRCREVAAK